MSPEVFEGGEAPGLLMDTLFYSRNHPGLVMNRYGIVLDGGIGQAPTRRAIVKAKAQTAGWQLEDSGDTSIGRVGVPPSK
jgi:hypothetical protein